MRHCFEWEACNIIDIDITLGSTPSQRSDELGGVSESTHTTLGCDGTRFKALLQLFHDTENYCVTHAWRATSIFVKRRLFNSLVFILSDHCSQRQSPLYSYNPAHIQRRNDPELPNYSYLASIHGRAGSSRTRGNHGSLCRIYQPFFLEISLSSNHSQNSLSDSSRHAYSITSLLGPLCPFYSLIYYRLTRAFFFSTLRHHSQYSWKSGKRISGSSRML